MLETIYMGSAEPLGECLRQYKSMPTASAQTYQKIVQYVGSTTASYTKAHFYEGSRTLVDSTATASKSEGCALTDVTVNKTTFETKITASGSYYFTFDGTNWKYNDSAVTLSDYGISYTATEQPSAATITQTAGTGLTVAVDKTTFETQITTEGCYIFNYLAKPTTVAYISVPFVNVLNRNPSADSGSAYAWTKNLVTVYTDSDIPEVGDKLYSDTALSEEFETITAVGTEGATTGYWAIGSVPGEVSLATYGITITGTPTIGDAVQVEYTEAFTPPKEYDVITVAYVAAHYTYSWEAIQVQ